MGNNDGLTNAIISQGTNEILELNENWYFSFALGDEIALVNEEKGDFYILNCSEKLWKQVRKFSKKSKKIEEVKAWWKKQSKKYQISNWSDDFEEL